MLKWKRYSAGIVLFISGAVCASMLPTATAEFVDTRAEMEQSGLPFDSRITRLSIPMSRGTFGPWQGRVVFDDGRTHGVTVDTVPTLFGPSGQRHAVRHVVARVWEGTTVPTDLMKRAIGETSEMGAFRLEDEAGRSRLVYRIDVPENSNVEYLERAVLNAALMADEMEKLAGSGTDIY